MEEEAQVVSEYSILELILLLVIVACLLLVFLFFLFLGGYILHDFVSLFVEGM